MSQFLKNAGWLSAAELGNRFMRLGSTVVVARALGPQDYGLAAIVLVIAEVTTVMSMRTGIGSMLVQVPEAELEQFCQSAYWMNWLIAIGAFLLQCGLAFPIAAIYQDSRLIAPICVLALTLLMTPTYLVQAALIYRANRFQVLALCNLGQSLIGNLATILLALGGFGLWAIVLPLLLATPIWGGVTHYYEGWRVGKIEKLELRIEKRREWGEILGFAMRLLGVELLGKVRANLDYLLIGQILGMKALGLYYFAFNAGLGISLNLIQSVTQSLYSHLCECQGDRRQLQQRYLSSLRTITKTIVPLILLQAVLAPWYIPIIFGNKWTTAIPIVVLICLSALPRPFAEAASTFLQSSDRGHQDLIWNVIFTLFFALSLGLAVHQGLISVAIAVLLSHCIAIPFFLRWVHQRILPI